MTKRVMMTAIALMLTTSGAAAQGRWSLELGSPLWGCLIECSGVQDQDELAMCLEGCGAEHDAGVSSAQETADVLRCQATLMRAQAAQFACHSRCLAYGTAESIGPCVDDCDRRYEVRSTLIMRTNRCAVMRSAAQ
jgi:hypothetical protein